MVGERRSLTWSHAQTGRRPDICAGMMELRHRRVGMRSLSITTSYDHEATPDAVLAFDSNYPSSKSWLGPLSKRRAAREAAQYTAPQSRPGRFDRRFAKGQFAPIHHALLLVDLRRARSAVSIVRTRRF